MNFTDWLKAQFAAVIAWFKHDEARFDNIDRVNNLQSAALGRIEEKLIAIEDDQDVFFSQMRREIQKMADEIQSAVEELNADTAVMGAATTALQALEENEKSLQAAIDALKAAGVADQQLHGQLQGSISLAAGARATLKAAVDAVPPTPVATTQQATSTTTETTTGPAATGT